MECVPGDCGQTGWIGFVSWRLMPAAYETFFDYVLHRLDFKAYNLLPPLRFLLTFFAQYFLFSWVTEPLPSTDDVSGLDLSSPASIDRHSSGELSSTAGYPSISSRRPQEERYCLKCNPRAVRPGDLCTSCAGFGSLALKSPRVVLGVVLGVVLRVVRKWF